MEKIIDIADALVTLRPKAEWVIRQDGLEWLSPEIEQPTEAEIDVEVKRLQAEYDAQEYARNRKDEYDALNQFELISDDDVNGTTTHKDAIAAIKTKWPKDNSGPK
jgi:hypothetical protein